MRLLVKTKGNFSSSPSLALCRSVYCHGHVSGMIVESELVHVSQAGNSSSMEKRGLRTVLERLQDAAITVSRLATDCNIQVTAMMKKEWPRIDHQFDVWYFAKSITKKLHKVCKKKSHEDLRVWIPCESNHLWWSASTCGENATLLKEKWQSVTHHVCNQHAWVGMYHLSHSFLPAHLLNSYADLGKGR